MQVILLDKVVNLGNLGDVVKVKDGYARNFLIPQKKAKRATPAAMAEFEARRAELEKAAAEKLEAEAKAWDQQSDEQMHQHHRWAQATTVLQVAIAMAAIALLSKKRWIEWAMYGSGALGVGVGVLAFLHI